MRFLSLTALFPSHICIFTASNSEVTLLNDNLSLHACVCVFGGRGSASRWLDKISKFWFFAGVVEICADASPCDFGTSWTDWWPTTHQTILPRSKTNKKDALKHLLTAANHPSLPLCYDSPGNMRFCNKQVATREPPGAYVTHIGAIILTKMRVWHTSTSSAPPCVIKNALCGRTGGTSLARRWKEEALCPEKHAVMCLPECGLVEIKDSGIGMQLKCFPVKACVYVCEGARKR